MPEDLVRLHAAKVWWRSGELSGTAEGGHHCRAACSHLVSPVAFVPPAVGHLSDRPGRLRVQFQQRYPYALLHLPLPGGIKEQFLGSEVSTPIAPRKPA